jgi:hypothetical protein
MLGTSVTLGLRLNTESSEFRRFTFGMAMRLFFTAQLEREWREQFALEIL